MTVTTDIDRQALFQYVLRLGDSSLILGHRLSEWCGHGPALEEDIAMTNIALDLIGQARMLLTYAGEVEGQDRDEDALAYRRDVLDWRNLLLVEQPNGDFAQTMARQFLFDSYSHVVYSGLAMSSDEQLRAIAAKAVKETSYHRRHSGDWVIRLGDGTEESHARMQAGLDAMWDFTGELFMMDGIDRALVEAGAGVDLEALQPLWEEHVDAVLAEAALMRPKAPRSVVGGRTQGVHTEHLGYILAELQYLPRAYPDAKW